MNKDNPETLRLHERPGETKTQALNHHTEAADRELIARKEAEASA